MQPDLASSWSFRNRRQITQRAVVTEDPTDYSVVLTNGNSPEVDLISGVMTSLVYTMVERWRGKNFLWEHLLF